MERIFDFFPVIFGGMFFLLALVFTTIVILAIKTAKTTKHTMEIETEKKILANRKAELEIEVLAAKLRKGPIKDEF